MGLKEYRSKRDFSRTPEPLVEAPVRGGKKASRRTKSVRSASAEHLMVVQRHDATNLHYDLRLQVGDVLVSWAVPKGPSLDPRDKRLAVHVEDHPLAYGDFEGVIPEGYGAGTVMIFDRGTWASDSGDPAKAIRDGMLKFRMEGRRLRGRWMLVRTKPGRSGQEHWLLVKERDEHAATGSSMEAFTTSVASGRTMAAIARGEAPVMSEPAKKTLEAKHLKGARASPMPARVRPQLAVASTTAPEGDEWMHEAKFDGYRLVAMVRAADRSVKLISRTGKDWTANFPTLAAAIADRLKVDAVLDGEAVVLDGRGISDFQALQNAVSGGRGAALVYFAFDLPWCDGFDLMRVRLDDRKRLLASFIGTAQEGRLRFSEHALGHGPQAFEHACRSGLEGIVSKRASSPYEQLRGPSWLKVKCFFQQEFVVAGFTPPDGTRDHFGALVLGYYADDGKLVYAGRVGSGFSSETLKRLSQRLTPLIRSASALARIPNDPDLRRATWIEPQLVAQVQFRDWTRDGTLRFPSFRGMREDVDPKTVMREQLAAAPSASPRSRKAPAKARPPVSETTPKGQGAGRTRLTHPDRIVYPDRGSGVSLTKRDLARYYEAVAALMLPQLAGRPLAVVRCPQGEGGKSFFQKHLAKGMPPSVGSVQFKSTEDDAEEQHLVIHDVDGLLALVQLNVLEFHTWGSTAGDVEHPDRLVFDLDPGPEVSFKQVAAAALVVREALRQVGLTGFARTTGGRGMHVVAPIKAIHDWAETKSFCSAFAATLTKVFPRRFVAVAGEHRREGRIYVDYLRNTRGATAIASYSTRARPGAGVAWPVTWSEVESGIEPAAFNAVTVPRLLAAGRADAWAGFDQAAGALTT